MMTLAALNALPPGVRDALYTRLIPAELLDRFQVDRTTLCGPGGERLVRVTTGEDRSWVRVELRRSEADRDPVVLVDVGMSPLAAPELALVQINDPDAPRFGIDRDEAGQDTLLGTASRNLAEEARALAAGLAPGQVRRGLGMLGRVLAAMDEFCRMLGRDVYLVEPLFYHSAVLYERHGCDYLVGRERMERIHEGFLPGGPYHRRLDDSTPFRRRGFEATVRGRSWAIHDGVLGEPFAGPGRVKMYRVPGRRAAVTTFPDGAY
ncbi:MAG TPA: hypothetical protein VNK50_02310 [Calidithermus sp.]|jgi:hypothetical protein|nr:hypothetical protein [Calidithermus sp.]